MQILYKMDNRNALQSLQRISKGAFCIERCLNDLVKNDLGVCVGRSM